MSSDMTPSADKTLDKTPAETPETTTGGRIYRPLAFDIADEYIQTQIGSSQRTTMGSMSISGATRNSSRTSRYPGRTPTAT